MIRGSGAAAGNSRRMRPLLSDARAVSQFAICCFATATATVVVMKWRLVIIIVKPGGAGDRFGHYCSNLVQKVGLSVSTQIGFDSKVSMNH